MDIDINKLDYSNYKLPNQITEDALKEILGCNYNGAIKLSEEEIIKRINILKDFIFKNKGDEDYRLEEWYIVGNMESNYRYVLAIKRGEIED